MKMSDRPLDGVAENPLEKYPQVAAGNAGRTGRAIDTLLLCVSDSNKTNCVYQR